jgi:manganese efflux pump family protein
MIGAILVLGVLAGLDNLQVCSSIGLLPLRKKRTHFLAAAFSFCEIAAAVLGVVLGHNLLSIFEGGTTTKFGALIMLVCGAIFLLLAVRQHDISRVVNGNAMLLGLPISLSLDNLVAGIGLGPSVCPAVYSALLIGFISAGMSCIGLYFGAWIRRLLPARMQPVLGAYICAVAIRVLCTGKM